MSVSQTYQTTTANLAAPTRLILRFLIAGIVWLLVMQAILERSLMPPVGLIQAVLLAIPTVMILRRTRGGLVTATVITALILLAAIPPLISDLSDPGKVVTFVWNVIAAPLFTALPFIAFRAVRRSRKA
jgi:hypothetical protein